MDKITSFTINHLKLLPGVYVSRKDKAGDTTVTTFDIRMTGTYTPGDAAPETQPPEGARVTELNLTGTAEPAPAPAESTR